MLMRVPHDRLAAYDEPARGAGDAGQEEVSDPLFAMVWRRRWTVLVVTLLCLVSGGLYLLKATPIFTSSSRLYVEQSGPRIMSDQQSGAPKSGSFLYTQAQLLTSTPILNQAIEAGKLKSFKSFDGVDNLLAYLKK